MTSVLTVKTNFLILSSEDTDLLENIYNTLSFADTSKAFYNGSFNKDRITQVRFSKYVEGLDLPSLRIPIGFLDFIQSVLEDYDHTVIDDRKPIKEIEVDDIENLEGIELVEHQIGAIYKALSRRRGIVRAPTASGKTEIFLAILNMLEKPSLVLFNREQLATQTVNRAAERGLDVGLVQGPHVQEKNITMATVQSIHKLKNIHKYKNLILDECFLGQAKILTENGWKNIRTICNNRSKEKVWSYNVKENCYELNEIIDWLIKPAVERKLVRVILNNKRASFMCTPEHKIYLSDFTKKKASDLNIGDRLVLKNKNQTCFGNGVCPTPSTLQYKAILGMILGDSHLQKSFNLARMSTTQGDTQKAYLEYKIKILNNLYSEEGSLLRKGKSGYNKEKNTWRVATRCSTEFLDLYKKAYLNNIKQSNLILKEIDEVSLAFWIMDDGYFTDKYYILSTQSFLLEENLAIIKSLKEKFNVEGKLVTQKRFNKTMFKIRFNKLDSLTIAEKICSYIIPSMQYKLPDIYKNKFIDRDYGKNDYGTLDISRLETRTKKVRVYDITVNNNHNYLIGDYGVLVSNCHNATSKSYQKVLKLAHWERVYGFSATPVDPKKMNLRSAKLIAYVGPVIYDVSAKELMEASIIAKPKIFMLPINQPDDIEDYNYKEAEMLGLIFNPYRNNLIKDLAEKHREEKVLILTKYIDQGREIAKLLPDAEFIWHEVPVSEREKTVARFESGELKILIASRILDEGIDIKEFKVLIIASAGISFIKTIQRLGRGLRVTEDKKNITVYDFMDNTNPKLLKHSRARKKTYKMFGYDDITVVEKIA